MIRQFKKERTNNQVLEFVKFSSRPFFTNSILNWQYSNPQSDLLFIDDDSVIKGTQGMIFHELYDWENSVEYKSFKSETTYVSNELRGSGAFENLYENATKFTRIQESKCIWGFTALSKVWENKLNFDVFENIIHEAYLDIKFKPGRNIMLLLKSIITSSKVKLKMLTLKKVQGLKLNENGNLLGELPILQQKISSRNKFLEIKFSHDFCEWRIKKNPILKYRLISFFSDKEVLRGYLIYNISNRVLRISDFNSIHDFEPTELLSELVKIASKNDCNKISFFGNINNPINKSFFSAFQNLGGSLIQNKNMNFVLKSFSSDSRLGVQSINSWRINGLWTEGFTF